MLYRLNSPATSLERVRSRVEALQRHARNIPSAAIDAPIAAIEAWVVNLPASESYFPQEFGALEFAISCASNALQLASGTVFSPTSPNEIRGELQRQYTYACFLAGLGSVLACPVRDFSVLAHARQWCSLSEPLRSFVAEGEDYEVHWRSKPFRVPQAAHGAWTVALAFGERAREAFTQDVVMRDFVLSIMPDSQPSAGEPITVNLVRKAMLTTISEFKARQAKTVIAPQLLSRAVATSDSAVDESSPADNKSRPADGRNNGLNDLKNTIGALKQGVSPHSTPQAVGPAVSERGQPAVAQTEPRVNDLLSEFDAWAREFFEGLRSDIEARKPLIRQMRVDAEGKGFVLSRQMIQRLGFADTKIMDYLAARRMLVERLPSAMIVCRELGAWLTQDGEYTVGTNEKVTG